MKRLILVLLKVLAGLVALVVLTSLTARVFTDTSQIARTLAWFDSDVQDYRRFPARTLHAAPPVFNFQTPTAEQQSRYAPLFERVDFQSDGRTIQREWNDFMEWTDTAAFLVIQDDVRLDAYS